MIIINILYVCVIYALSVNSQEYNGVKHVGVFCDRPDWNIQLRATLSVAQASLYETATRLNVSYQLEGRFQELAPQDALDAGEEVCKMLAEYSDLAGIIAPFNGDSLTHVQAVCDLLDVPLLMTHAAERARDWTAANLFPHYSAFTQAVIELIEVKGWTSFTVIYEDAEGLDRLSGILAMSAFSKNYYISARQLPDGDNYRPLLLVMKDSEAENFVVDCRVESASLFLEQAQQVGVISEPYAYIFTNPDLHTVDLDRYSYGGANITGFRIFDVNSTGVIAFTAALNEEYRKLLDSPAAELPSPLTDFTPERLPSALPLTYDAVRLFGAALDKLVNLSSTTLDCDSGAGLVYGSTLINHIRTMKMDGLTGIIRFDEEGDRSDVVLEVLELVEGGAMMKVGHWSKIDIAKKDATRSLMIDRIPIVIDEDDTDTMKNKSFVVLISLTPPYGMRRESTQKLDGNERYEGFCVELIHELSKILGFTYTFEVQEDGKYGNYNQTTKEWDGMLRKVIDGTVDFAITDLTITAEREGAVDFTTPFMNLGISILFKKPEQPAPEVFSFLLPFSKGVWLSLGGAYLGCSVLLYLLGRICPDEWQNPYPCVEEPEALENQFTFANALWFNLGAVLLQGSEIAPVAYGTRAVASMWWFFALIITSSYTANLASLLSYAQKFEPIHSVQDLADNTFNITYGAKEGGSTFSFFRESNNPLFKRMYEFMEANPHLLCNSNDNGTKRVLEGNYAFLMESTSIEYLVERQCNLTQIGQLLDNKGYGLAMKKDSVYRQKLNLAMLNLLEQGKLAQMKKKWWKEQRGGGVCVESDDTDSAELGLAKVGGVFIVLVVGCCMGLLVSFTDMTISVYRRAKQYQIPFMDEFKSELKFVFTFSAVTKPMRPHMLNEGTDSSQALTLQSIQTTPEREENDQSLSQSPAPLATPPQVESRRQSGHASKFNSRQASLRSRTGRRRSTMHDNSIRLARQSVRN